MAFVSPHRSSWSRDGDTNFDRATGLSIREHNDVTTCDVCRSRRNVECILLKLVQVNFISTSTDKTEIVYESVESDSRLSDTNIRNDDKNTSITTVAVQHQPTNVSIFMCAQRCTYVTFKQCGSEDCITI